MKNFLRIISLVLACMLLCSTTALADYWQLPADCADVIAVLSPKNGAPIKLTAYSQLANYSGVQTGWGATLLKDLFNVELNIVPDQDGTYETRMNSGNLGDLVIWGSNGADYQKAVAADMLFDWEEDWGDGKLIDIYAPYVAANYTDAL